MHPNKWDMCIIIKLTPTWKRENFNDSSFPERDLSCKNMS